MEIAEELMHGRTNNHVPTSYDMHVCILPDSRDTGNGFGWKARNWEKARIWLGCQSRDRGLRVSSSVSILASQASAPLYCFEVLYS